MSDSPICRVCLSGNYQMYTIKDVLLRKYEQTMRMKVIAKDGRPETLCFICYAQLKKFLQLLDTARKSEMIFRRLLANNIEVNYTTTMALNKRKRSRFSIYRMKPISVFIPSKQNVIPVVKKEIIDTEIILDDESIDTDAVDTSNLVDEDMKETVQEEKIAAANIKDNKFHLEPDKFNDVLIDNELTEAVKKELINNTINKNMHTVKEIETDQSMPIRPVEISDVESNDEINVVLKKEAIEKHIEKNTCTESFQENNTLKHAEITKKIKKEDEDCIVVEDSQAVIIVDDYDGPEMALRNEIAKTITDYLTQQSNLQKLNSTKCEVAKAEVQTKVEPLVLQPLEHEENYHIVQELKQGLIVNGEEYCVIDDSEENVNISIQLALALMLDRDECEDPENVTKNEMRCDVLENADTLHAFDEKNYDNLGEPLIKNGLKCNLYNDIAHMMANETAWDGLEEGEIPDSADEEEEHSDSAQTLIINEDQCNMKENTKTHTLKIGSEKCGTLKNGEIPKKMAGKRNNVFDNSGHFITASPKKCNNLEDSANRLTIEEEDELADGDLILFDQPSEDMNLSLQYISDSERVRFMNENAEHRLIVNGNEGDNLQVQDVSLSSDALSNTLDTPITGNKDKTPLNKIDEIFGVSDDSEDGLIIEDNMKLAPVSKTNKVSNKFKKSLQCSEKDSLGDNTDSKESLSDADNFAFIYCLVCMKTFSSRKTLKKHEKKAHTGNTMCTNYSCHGNNTVCSPERRGPTCLCLPSFARQYNYMTQHCDDVNECELERPQCSHRCINGDGHFRCQCDPGYTTDLFGYLCYAKGPEAMLFFTTRNEIKFLKVKSKQLVTVATGIKQAHGVAYDGKYLYWVEAAQGHQAIVRAHLEDFQQSKEVLVGLGLEEPGDISIDWLGGNLFFSDAARGIFACRLDGAHCTMIPTHAEHPKYLTVDPRNGKMYWADFLGRAVIMSANMDGTNPDILVDNLDSFATGLAVDVPNERLYYVEKTVRVVMLNGKKVYSLFEEPFHHPYAISVFENTVFWSDWTSNSIQSADKLHGSHQKRNVLLSMNTPVFGMHMYHPALMRSASNPCAVRNCSHFCFVTSDRAAECACPHGMQLTGNTCQPIPGYRPQYLVVGGAQLFTRIQLDSLGNPESHAAHFDIGRVQAMAYDSRRDTLYLYDGQRRSINRINMSEFTLGLTHLFLHQGLSNVVDMDYDYATDALYFLDAGRRLIEVVSLRTEQRALLYKFNDEVPISFCLMPDYGRMLVAIVESEQDNKIHIDSIGLDGEGRRHVILNDLRGPHVRLKYAKFMDNVFVSDEGNGIIDFMHPEGTGRENYRALSTTVSSLAVTDAHVFWTDRRTPRLFWSDVHESTHRIRRIDLSMFPNSTQLLIQTTSPHPSPTPLPHPCLNPNTCSYVCVQSPGTNVHSLSYKCLCPPGLLFKDGKCTQLLECKEYELYCHRSNVCIEKRKYCDGVKDCAFGEDEADCKVLPAYSPVVCSETEFQCHNSSVCISRSQVCDSRRECPDGSDEARAECDTLSCFDSEFMCASGSCILSTWKCDGDLDCNDGTDEIGCEDVACKAGFYQCRNKECIEVKKRCDGLQDCFDFSDEEECDEPVIVDVEEEVLPHCEVFEYACELNRSICLPLTARCNMKVECPGATDEDGCDFRCNPHGLFACQQQLECVGYNRLCDGRRDCGDGSDETPDACAIVNKTSHRYPPVLLPISECRDGYLCANGQCAEWRDVCDRAPHCSDGSDEGGHCSSACVNHTCSHVCQATPHGPQCACPSGFHNAGPYICEDMDECALEPCSQLCINTPGSFLCSCHHGYALRADRRSCKAVRGNMSVLYLSGNTVRSVSADGKGAVEYSDHAIAAFSDLDCNVRKDKLYVTSTESSKLIEVNGTHNVVAITNVGRPTRVALDWITGNVYFVDSTPGDSCIRVCNIEKKRCAKLQKLPSDGDVKISSLIVDPKSRLMFYCVTRALESVIWAAPLSGRNPRDLTTVRNCTGLAVDSFAQTLYVAETGPPHIIRMNYEGDGHTRILADHPQLQAPHSLAIFEDHIYYLVANSFRLSRCMLFGQKHCETYIYRVFDANTFVIRHESVQRDDVKNDCHDVVCGNICVLDARGPACVCGDGSFAKDGACALMKKEDLPLFNGWSQQDYMRAHHASFAIIAAALVLLALYIGLFIYYHFVHKPRKIRNSAYTEVRYQNNPASDAPSLSYTPSVDMAADGSISHEFVNPLQYVRSMWRHSFRRPRPVGTAALNIEVSPIISHSPEQAYSDTESDFDDREKLIIRRK